MKYTYLILALLLMIPQMGAFTYMGNNTLLVTNATGYVWRLDHNESMNMSNSTYHLLLEAPNQEIDVAMVNTFLTRFTYQLLFGVVLVLAVFYFMFRMALGYAG